MSERASRRVRRRPLTRSGLLAEIGAYAMSGLLWPWPGVRLSAEGERMVLFIHGSFGNPGMFFPMQTWLRRWGKTGAGSRLEFSHFRYRSGPTVEMLAQRLAAHVETLAVPKIDLVCHSLGGIVARVFMEELGGAERVQSCTFIATPHHGTPVAFWARWNPEAQLRPGSEVLRRLAASDPTRFQVRWASIASSSDQMVRPEDTEFPAGMYADFHDLGHTTLVYHPSVWRTVDTVLTANGEGPAVEELSERLRQAG